MSKTAPNPFRPAKVETKTGLAADATLQATADRYNAGAKKAGWDRWYFVTARGGKQQLESVEGHKAITMRKAAEQAQRERLAAMARNPAEGGPDANPR